MSAGRVNTGLVTVLASAARTATATSSAFKRGRARGVLIVMEATALAATPSVVPKLQQYVSATDTWTDVLAGVAVTAAGAQVILIHPSAPDVANVSENTALTGEQLRVVCTAADADSLTYSVSAFLLP